MRRRRPFGMAVAMKRPPPSPHTVPIPSLTTAEHPRDARRPPWTVRAALVPLITVAGMAVAKTINETSFWVADRLFPPLAGLDPDGVFLHITFHHVAQLAMTLGIMAAAIRLVPGQSWRGFGFTWNRTRESLAWVGVFAGVWLVIQTVGGVLLVSQGTSADPGYPRDARNVIGVLAFQLLLSGSSEEPLFRGLIMTAMLAGWVRVFASERALGWCAVAGSTLVFMFDHVNFSLTPFAVTHVNLLQQATLLTFGVFYGVVFWRTRSLVGPIVAHGVLNVIITVAGYGLFLWMAP